jgi:hypothetical protein
LGKLFELLKDSKRGITDLHRNDLEDRIHPLADGQAEKSKVRTWPSR